MEDTYRYSNLFYSVLLYSTVRIYTVMHSKNILGYRGREIVWRGFRVLKPYTVRNFEVTTVLKVWEAHCQNINGFISDPPSNLRTLLLQNLWSCDIQRGRRLDGWPNTSARLAGWRRVTRHVWFCTWKTDRSACLFCTVYWLPWQVLPSCELKEFQAAVI
jgi:hypothetical protein